MSNDLDTPATKRDLQELATKKEMEQLQANLTLHIDEVKDQILRAFKITEESIRQESAHRDELAGIDSRLCRVEEHLGVGDF